MKPWGFTQLSIIVITHYFPKIDFNIILPIFCSNPALEVGIPVSRANFRLACVIPKARFKEKLTPGILIFDITIYFYIKSFSYFF